MTKVEQSIVVGVPIRTAYNQWTQFESFPQFMSGVEAVEQLDERTLRWVAEIAGVRRQWTATILEQIVDRKVAWAATEGATNAGAVFFAEVEPGRTRVHLHLDFEPEGPVEKAGDALGIVERQANADLERFKEFIESRGGETGAWRGEFTDQRSVGIPNADDAALSRDDAGKAGVSKGAVAAGVAGAAVAAGAVAGAVTAATRSASPDIPAEDQEVIDLSSPDVVDVLTHDHNEAKLLLRQIWAADDTSVRRDLTDTLISEIVRHAVAEEMYVYPAMRAHMPNGEEAAAHDVEEHKELEKIMKRLEAADPAGPSFTEDLRQFEAVFADHVTDEESEHFPQLRASIPLRELVDLAEKVEAAKKRAPTRPHPAAPNAELFHKIVGPGVGLVDRLRDRLSGRATV